MRPLASALVLSFVLALVPASIAGARTLAPPKLEQPAAGASVEQVEAFTWKAVKHAASYEYQVSADRKFGAMVLGVGFGKGNGKTPNTAVGLKETIPDGTYFWRVRTIDGKKKAGKWSATRTFVKDWSAQPTLLSPGEGSGVAWPNSPLVLRWSEVPYAHEYQVTIATDPALSSPVIGGTSKPVSTRGTVATLTDTLPPGRYYWVVRPYDIGGHSGRVSKVGSFTWSWPTATPTRVTDLDERQEVFDPQFSWDAVPGAAYYDVEVNASQDFASGSRVCCDDEVTGTSLSPVQVFPNNLYYWRVRAIDPAGNAGQWNQGPSFDKKFDAKVPSVPNLRMQDRHGDTPPTPQPPPAPPVPPVTETPIAVWDPVPGASSYEVQVTKWDSGCDWGSRIVGPGPTQPEITAGTAWAALAAPAFFSKGPGPAAWGRPRTDRVAYTPGSSYCVRVLARSDRPGATDNGFISDWTYLNGFNNAAFTYKAPDPDPRPKPSPFVLPASSYLKPSTGTLTTRMPYFTWEAVPQAAGYYVVVSKDPTFTTVVDYAFTTHTAYTPGSGLTSVTYPDETTSYYWMVLPAAEANGDGATAGVLDGATSPTPFDKRSVPPTLLAPTGGMSVDLATSFRWSPVEAARRYRVQVATDPTFSDPIDDLTTAALSYTSTTPYPADADLFWRVQALDENKIGLGWSASGSFRRRLAIPSPFGDMPAAGAGIPVLSFTPIPGAVSYDIHVEQSDGKQRDFTVRSPVFAPTAFYGSGVFTWRARANFPTRLGQPPVAGGYFAPLNFVRSIPAPGRAIGTKTSTRLLIDWDPVPAAEKYTVDIGTDNDFVGAAAETTENTSFAPDLGTEVVRNGGKLYWRVQAMDEGRARGTAATGTFTLPKGITVKVTGRPARGKRLKLKVQALDTRGAAVSRATIRMSGGGLKSVRRTADKRGRVTFTVKPKRRLKLVFSATKKGFRAGRGEVPVR